MNRALTDDARLAHARAALLVARTLLRDAAALCTLDAATREGVLAEALAAEGSAAVVAALRVRASRHRAALRARRAA